MSNYPEAYWIGVLDTCEYFRDELGIEDAMDSNMAQWAMSVVGDRVEL